MKRQTSFITSSLNNLKVHKKLVFPLQFSPIIVSLRYGMHKNAALCVGKNEMR